MRAAEAACTIQEDGVLPGAGVTAVAIGACRGCAQMQCVETGEEGVRSWGSGVEGGRYCNGLQCGGAGSVRGVLSIWKGGNYGGGVSLAQSHR